MTSTSSRTFAGTSTSTAAPVPGGIATIAFGSTPSVAGTFGYLWADGPERPDGGSPEPVVIGSGWTADPGELLALIHPTLIHPGLTHPSRMQPASATRIDVRGHPVIEEAVARYSDGDLTAIDRITVRQRSGPFIEAAWQALRRTPPGLRTTYTDLAAGAGRPEAIRAAAAACAYNAAALFVPCHRIVRRDGSPGGFRYGLEVKRRLLDHESAGRVADH